MADPEVDLFAGMKKKKKKVVAADVDEAPSPAPADEPASPAPAPVESVPTPAPEAPAAAPPAADEAPAEDAGDLFADLKKKKKKKKDIPLDLEAAEPSAEGAGDVQMKKKKSKKPAADFAKELDEMDAEQADEAGDDDGDLGDDVFAAQAEGGRETGGLDPWVVENRDPTYPERFFTLLHLNNPELAGEKRRFTTVPPQVARDGSKKTMFANFIDITRRLHRQPEHVLMFLYAELGTQGAMDGAQRLVLRGRFSQKQIENVLRKYIVEYVRCKDCKSPDTLLGKENRLFFVTCESCGSRRSVSAIKSGFQAQIGRRIKAP